MAGGTHPAHQLVADALAMSAASRLGLLDLLDVELDPVLEARDLFELLSSGGRPRSLAGR